MTQAIQKTLRDSAGMRWTALLLLALAMFCSYIFMDILSPIKDLMQETVLPSNKSATTSSCQRERLGIDSST